MRPVLYILCGLPFSGKSVLAAALSRRCGFELVSVDAIKTEHGLRDVWEDMKPEDWQKIFAESFLLVRHALQRGDSVIHDSANQTRESRDQLRAITHELVRQPHFIS
jgi:predicted kinase